MWLLYMGLSVWEALHVASVHGVKLVEAVHVASVHGVKLVGGCTCGFCTWG